MPKPIVRLFQPAVMTGFKRSKRKQDPHVAILAIKNVATRKHTDFYLGKRCVYLYRGKKKVAGRKGSKVKTNMRRIWGRITRSHGKAGCVKAVFKPNLPGESIGRKVRIYLFPSSI
uniref:60S large subunit ribosomal protein eL33 n=1 Tax=Euglena gracilis TaxID=3039 RepID=A0A7L5NT30_EUGGR|nr:60S large subunit ribosomal protein eL33 [Euglena gracilis]6ZJ3_Lv Chain Lv, Ribosomal protein eL33 [Euglena gracilis]